MIVNQYTVLRVAHINLPPVDGLLRRFDLKLMLVARDEDIPSSYWGDDEAGVSADMVFIRPDTPVHSMLHEAAHAICCAPERRKVLDTDAGGDDLEESAVCYLQVELAACLPEVGRARMLHDMDCWGYSFRLGSALRWLAVDADDAQAWLLTRGLLNVDGRLRIPA